MTLTSADEPGVAGTDPDDEAPPPFDLGEPLAEGVTLLEASAGTGKTHTVASLVVREVAHGRPLDELLVVTFTRKATGTLRERVWERLSATAKALAPHAPPAGDELAERLRSGPEGEVAARRQRLERALSDFDAATIATTHGFCQHVLAGLGVAGDAEREVVLVEDIGTLVADAVDDLFVRRFHDGDEVPFDLAAARRVAEAVVANPDCRIAGVDDTPADRLRRRFAVTLRDRVVAQKRRGRVITYDDLLARLDDSLGDDERGAIVAERLRRRYTMAIVDEFQDTDSVQWRVLRKAFGAPPGRLVLVGDPKQAIYAFRGGDVFAYLEATRAAGHRRGLPTSWRADQPLLDATDALLGGAQLGDASIRHRPLRARPGAERSALVGPAAGAPLTVRIAHRDHDGVGLTARGWAEKASTRRVIAADLAGQATRLLEAGTTLHGEPLAPGHLAVLTRTRHDAQTALAALSAAGVPAVAHGGANVFATPAARHWLDLLRALEQPASEARVHTVAHGPFIGWSAARLAGAGEADREALDGALHEWAAALRSRSVAGLLHRIEATHGPTSRLRGLVGGERQLSDLRQVAELLHQQHSTRPGSLAGLAQWLSEQVAAAEGGGDPASEAARRRLESDADAVAVHTVHGAKGLEFPVVLLPSVWEAPPVDEDAPPVFHDDDGRRCVGVGGGGGRVHRHQLDRAADERDQEDLRLLYVALTRARHQVVLWWATGADAHRSAFARLLLGRGAGGLVARQLASRPREADIATAAAALGLPVEAAGDLAGRRYRPRRSAPTALSVRPFERRFDPHWARTSYTGLTRAAHEAGAGAPWALDDDALDAAAATGPAVPPEPDEGGSADEPDLVTSPAPVEGPLASPLPLAGLPGGARVGTLVHDVLERADFAAADLVGELARAAAEAGARRALGAQADTLVDGLALALDTPLGPRFAGARLRQLRRADRRDELAFDLPLAGGDRPGPHLVTVDAVADVFARLPGDDPLAGYHERLRDPLLAAAVRGFLTGSIDLVARLGDRYVVVDYKTNHLAPPGEAAVAWHYRPAALVDAMQAAHYPLQAAFYVVALHRFLRWRLPGYEPERHLGGVAYLFLRGMAGPATPTVGGTPCGVFAWGPPAGFVVELSDLLDRGVAAGAGGR